MRVKHTGDPPAGHSAVVRFCPSIALETGVSRLGASRGSHGLSEPASQAAEQSSRGVSPGLGCLFTIVIGVLAAALLLLTLSIALRGEARFSKGELGAIRLWVIREDQNQGLAFSTTRIVDGSESSGEACIQTTARFLMLRSAQPVEDVEFCECFEKSGGRWATTGACP